MKSERGKRSCLKISFIFCLPDVTPFLDSVQQDPTSDNQSQSKTAQQSMAVKDRSYIRKNSMQIQISILPECCYVWYFCDFFPQWLRHLNTAEHYYCLKRKHLISIFFLNKEDITCSCQSSTCKVEVLKDSEGRTGGYPLMLVFIQSEA